MGQVTLSIGGYQYQLACRDGEEGHLLKLGEIVDSRVQFARQAVGNASETRQLLMAALLFADDSQSGGTPAPSSGDDPATANRLESLASHIEAIAATLERNAATR
jgi:cell division protein ZapA